MVLSFNGKFSIRVISFIKGELFLKKRKVICVIKLRSNLFLFYYPHLELFGYFPVFPLLL